MRLQKQERGDDWIEWGGDIDGLPPVGGEVIVEVEWSDGTVDSGLAPHWRWRHIPNIISYRIIPENSDEN